MLLAMLMHAPSLYDKVISKRDILFGCCIMSVLMVALSSGRMLTAAGILICSTSHTGSADYDIGECESRLLGFYFTVVLLLAAGTLSTTLDVR